MQDYAPSIYDYRNGELDNAVRIRRERRAAIVEAIVAVPVLAALFVAWVVLCAVL